MINKITILNLVIKDSHAFQASHMPFVSGGGVFVPCEKQPTLGSDLFLVFRFELKEDNVQTVAATGRVIWVARERVRGFRKPGFGIQLTDPFININSVLNNTNYENSSGKQASANIN